MTVSRSLAKMTQPDVLLEEHSVMPNSLAVPEPTWCTTTSFLGLPSLNTCCNSFTVMWKHRHVVTAKVWSVCRWERNAAVGGPILTLAAAACRIKPTPISKRYVLPPAWTTKEDPCRFGFGRGIPGPGTRCCPAPLRSGKSLLLEKTIHAASYTDGCSRISAKARSRVESAWLFAVPASLANDGAMCFNLASAALFMCEVSAF